VILLCINCLLRIAGESRLLDCMKQYANCKHYIVGIDIVNLNSFFQVWIPDATLGYAQAATDKRVIACIGDGSFQVTAQDISIITQISFGLFKYGW